MSENYYTKGSKVRVSVDPDNPFKVGTVITDPTGVIVRYRDPTGVIVVKTYGTDVEVVKVSTGIYYLDVVANVSGEWTYRWEGSGACVAVTEDSFYVEPSRF